MPKLAVLGHPVSHSRSPAMQNAALADLGLALEWTYEAIEVAPEVFDQLVRSLPEKGFAGVNVTVPHKVAALAVADEATHAAQAIGAANTLTFANGRIAADNTDTVGIVGSLPAAPRGLRALVMGAGGSARAAVWALREEGAEVSIWNRTEARAATLASEFGVNHATNNEGELSAGDWDLIVNTTTVGLAEANTTSSRGQTPRESGIEALKGLPIGADGLLEAHVVIDLVYGAKETTLIAAARAAGATSVDGLEVLVRQGAASLRSWTGAQPSLDVMRRAARGEV